VSYIFINKPAVKADIVNAVDYYKNISPKLARQFLFRIREAKIYIKRAPLAFEVKYKNVRTLMLKQFPFHVHYVIDDSRMEIIIIAIVHAYRHPADYSVR
jgi:plasmid stabilization system protein ParE